jgi:hypothetical protein
MSLQARRVDPPNFVARAARRTWCATCPGGRAARDSRRSEGWEERSGGATINTAATLTAPRREE